MGFTAKRCTQELHAKTLDLNTYRVRLPTLKIEKIIHCLRYLPDSGRSLTRAHVSCVSGHQWSKRPRTLPPADVSKAVTLMMTMSATVVHVQERSTKTGRKDQK
mmetsp:Transcript_7451/g.15197  ORF Transcript_7451/g.15197 Transcript_7451/m.15197 type:complete len:104 (+) Transcript_7451:1203-1514(+)